MRKMTCLLAGSVFMAPDLGLSAAHAQNLNAEGPYVPKACPTHVTVAPTNVADDPNLNPAVREFLIPLNKIPVRFGNCRNPGRRRY